MKLNSKKIESICSMIQLRAEFNGLNINSITEVQLDSLIKNELTYIELNVDEEDYQKVRKECESQFFIKHQEGDCIVDDYDEPYDWYTTKSKLEDIDPYFWKRYKYHLIQSENWSISGVNSLDNTLNDLMNYIANPINTALIIKRGLVIGDVQSGKTSTYTGLICKAADAGYRIVILLTGVTETLRAQTQIRMEEGIIGFSITGQKSKTKNIERKRVGVGLDGGPLKVTAMTSIEYDFIGSVDKRITTSLESNRLIMFIVKKNTKVLNRLYHWLYDINVDNSDKKIHYPMLMIDDEADNASINTNKEEEDPTKTNEIIRKLVNVFTQTSYIGFTATPYANVFINPDTTEEMVNDDLFPKNFIYVLKPPTNYIGAKQIFGKEAKYKDSVKWIMDIQEPDELTNPEEFDYKNNFFYKHPKDWSGNLPFSLKSAVYCFFLVNVVRDLRGDSQKPRTMMINISRFVKVQKFIKEKIETLFNNVYDQIRIDFNENDKKNHGLELYQELKHCWHSNFSDINFTWEEVSNKHKLLNAIKDIQVLVINSGKDSGKLDYDHNPSLRVIAIGGLALSRGLTLEGLIVSYFYRNTSTFDVLMQMGRWFGYRKNYEDLFRIWTSKKSAQWYNDIAESTDELKRDVRRMIDLKKTPEDFGLRIRNDSIELKITAANKMRNAIDHFEQISYWGEVFETPYLDIDIEKNKRNLNLSLQFINKTSNSGFQFNKVEISGNLFFCQNLPLEFIIKYLKELDISTHNIHFDTKQILDFLENSNEGILNKWDVVLLEGNKKDKPYNISPTMTIMPVERSFDIRNNRINISKQSGRLGSPTDAKIGLTATQVSIAELKAIENKDWDGISSTINQKVWFKHVKNRNPMLMIYFIMLKADDDAKSEQSLLNNLNGSPVMGYSIGIPMCNSTQAAEFHSYKVSINYNKQKLEEEFAETIEE